MKKSHLVLLISILAIFIVSMGIIIYNKLNPKDTTEETVWHNYAQQTTVESTLETTMSTYEVEDYGFEYEHMERLTFAQEAVRVQMNNLVFDYFIYNNHKDETILKAVISESSTEEFVFIDFTFLSKDGIEYTDTAVVIYDTYMKNTFTRCISIDEYNQIFNV